jgi:cytochrome c-type biogenesis protein CcmF
MVATPFHFQISLWFWMLLLVFLCIFVAVGNIWRITELVRRSPLGIGGFIAHLGLATLMGGLIISRGYQQEDQIFVRPGQPAMGLGNVINYKGRTDTALDDRSSRVFFDVQSPNGEHYQIDPNIYLTKEQDENGQPKWMSWPYILRQPSHDVYYFAGGPDIYAWPGPQTLKPGQSFTQKDVSVAYVKSTMKGQPGTVGVTFGALVRLTDEGQDGERHQFEANPTIKLTENGLEPSMVQIGPDFQIAIAGGMNAEDKSVPLMLFFSPPYYPITIFYKPLTILVWAGAGIMTLGALIAAWSRRRAKAKAPTSTEKASNEPAKKSAPTEAQLIHAAEGL